MRPCLPVRLQQYARASFTGGQWPPQGIEVFDPWHLPLLNTVILLTSGATVTWAHHGLREGNKNHLVLGLVLTCALGALFTVVQAYEYGHAPFSFTDGIYPSVFFMATGFHGAHVLIGTVFLLVCLGRAMRDHFKPGASFRLRGGGMVLALCRRCVAVPVCLHLLVGRQLSRPAPTLGVALRRRCPACGQGKLYSSYLKVADRCSVCGLDLKRQDSGDGPRRCS